MFRALREPLGSPWAVALLIAVCALLGALHALTPGHGKAMLAGYLVGSRGTARHAFALGGVITATHTGSVLLLGGAVLVAGHYVVPGLLVPALKILTGLAVLVIGVRIALRRWRGLRSRVSDHDHGYDAHRPDRFDEEDDDEDEVYSVDLGADRGYRRPPEHAWPYDRGVVLTAEREVIPQSAASRRRELAAMGAAGGLIPCPEALGVLILAAGMDRMALGLSMIVAFSVGLAAVLVGFGLILISARDRFAGMRPGPLFNRLPLVSAVLVVVLGLMMTVSGSLEAFGP